MAASRTRHERADPHMFTSSDDDAMLKYILATHAPDGTYFDVKPFLEIIENVVYTANHANQARHVSTAERDISNDVNEVLEVMAITINKVSCEISSKCIGGGDAHTTTMGIFNMLSNYAWDAKAVITLSAFAVNYAEFWLVAQLYISNSLAKSVTRLKQLPDMLEPGKALNQRFEAFDKLIMFVLDLTRCIVEFKMLPEQYISPEFPELVLATTHIPTAVYWIIRSIVACASILINLIGMGHERIMKTTDEWELSSLFYKIRNFLDHLRTQLIPCYEHIEKNWQTELYDKLPRVTSTPHLDNSQSLKHLICLRNDDSAPLYEGRTMTRVSIEILKKKTVLLLISDLDVPQEELSIVDVMYTEAKLDPTRYENDRYEVVWLPVVPDHRKESWTDGNQRKFEELRNMMPWYSVLSPLSLEPAVIKYIKEVWHFDKKPLLVAMDPQGRIVNMNALHMMWIWGSLAFPFTSLREEALWKEETWRMELLVDSIDPMILNWIEDGKYICLYGGEDIEWIRKFTRSAQGVARAANISLEMLYVGKSKSREKLRHINYIIQAEKLSHVFQDLTLMWFFWARLEAMLFSKLKDVNSSSDELDPILQEINVMLTYDGSDQSWAVMSHGSHDWMQRVNGDTVLTGLSEYEYWKDQVIMNGFLPALNEHLMGIMSPHHCNRLILPGTTWPDRIVCADCGRLMERFAMYRCCVD